MSMSEDQQHDDEDRMGALMDALDSSDDEEKNDGTFFTANETINNRTKTSDSFVSAPSDVDSFLSEDGDEMGENSPNSTLTDRQLHEQLAELENQKAALLKKLKGGGGKCTPSPKNEKKSFKDRNSSAPKLVPLNFDDATTSQISCSSNDFAKEKGFVREEHDSDDEDNEMLVHKHLSEAGRELKSIITKSTASKEYSLSKLVAEAASPKPKKVESAKLGVIGGSSQVKSKASVTEYDPFFKFKVRNPKVSSDTFEILCDGVQKVRLGDLTHANAPTGGFMTMAVLVDKSETRKSANGNEYMIWKLHDLRDAQKPPVKTFLFGEAFKHYVKLMSGVVLALVNPMVGEPNGNDKSFSLKCVRPAQIVEIGWSADLGSCRGVKTDGTPCQNFVNISLSEYCVYHVMAQARKLSSKRGTFNSCNSTQPIRKQMHANIPKFGLSQGNRRPLPNANTALNASGTMKAAADMTLRPSGEKVVSKEEEKKQLNTLISARSHLLGARNLVRLASSKEDKEVVKGPVKAASIAAFLKDQKIRDDHEELRQKEEERKARIAALRAEGPVPRLGMGLAGPNDVICLTSPRQKGKIDPEAAKRRAIEILRRDKKESAIGLTPNKGKKRPMQDESSSAKRERLTGSKENLEAQTKELEELGDILNKGSKFAGKAAKSSDDVLTKYFDNMEAKEKIETFTTTTMEVKNVKVVSCKKCNYTAHKQSELCMQNGHAVKWHTAEKRFFKCRGCKRRTFAFGLLPSKPCDHCDTQDWERVGMRDERKVLLDSEKLMLRDERTNVMS